ncbi:hypothetical protein [Croceicoccus naphthovorans]|uniref:hypothetical protein n=1 Tax=Croceicoccus naphthovorans TaxID=1348774 RepID=UPI00069D0D5A|nr:hypothetical protein [Croceicoccus naphthovorans]MBB3990795.1 hypothetical protein [Croceicoccus naphthovorans]
MVLSLVLAAAVAATTLPPETTVLAAPEPGFALPVCSRNAAGAVDGGWDPQDADVIAMEAALAPVLQSLAAQPGYTPGTETPDPLSYIVADPRWSREVFGIVRNGRRIIYGNYLPSSVEPNPKYMPTSVCDGGPVFFGVEYDMGTNAITHIAFNGGLGGPFWPDYAR